eukprot:scaffold132912_cov20-Tisochrysis_lutea.AAC.4
MPNQIVHMKSELVCCICTGHVRLQLGPSGVEVGRTQGCICFVACLLRWLYSKLINGSGGFREGPMTPQQPP